MLGSFAQKPYVAVFQQVTGSLPLCYRPFNGPQRAHLRLGFVGLRVYSCVFQVHIKGDQVLNSIELDALEAPPWRAR